MNHKLIIILRNVRTVALFGWFVCLLICSCSFTQQQPAVAVGDTATLQTITPKDTIKLFTSDDITLTKELRYDKYTLDDTYPYKDTTRQFQWDKIKARLALLENLNDSTKRWIIFSNYKNRNGESPVVASFTRNDYNHIVDTLGTERYQSVPLYMLSDTLTPRIYGNDGSLAQWLGSEGSFSEVTPIFRGGKWYIPERYVKYIPDSVVFNKAIFVDRTNQNITTLERQQRGKWVILSMNPATTGRHKPPYAHETPLGIFVVQNKLPRMIFLKDGTNVTGGFAPYANRFSNGAYIHGVPTNLPNESIIEYSPSLGTTPRSHMCVRNVTSHAKFIYDWGTVNETIVFVLE